MVLQGDRIHNFKHIEDAPISLEEAHEREEQFLSIFQSRIDEARRLPTEYSPELPAFRSSNRCFIVADVEDREIYLSFLQTGNPDKPLRAKLTIGQTDSKIYARYSYMSPIPPPPGYEDYDLTPAPHSAEITHQKRPGKQEVTESNRPLVNSNEVIEASKPEASEPETRFPWWLVAIAATLLGVIGLGKMKKR